MKQFNVVDLFAGAGGLSLGFEQTKKFSVVAAAENNPNARQTYKQNHKETRLYSDVRTIDYSDIKKEFGEIDVVIGGPPCQGFSNANRQHTTIISSNNRLVKDYVRAILELEPLAFVMENVAMLRSTVHRFIIDESDIGNDTVMNLPLSNERIELLPPGIKIPDVLSFIKNTQCISDFSWNDKLFKIITILYRYRINQPKFDNAVIKYKNDLNVFLQPYLENEIQNDTPYITKSEYMMAKSIFNYIDNENINFDSVVKSIEVPLMIQRMLKKLWEVNENSLHIFDYELTEEGAVYIHVKSYSVLDYIKGILNHRYVLSPMILNAADFGAPQKRERFIIVGISTGINKEYKEPEPLITDGKYYTVRDAIEDIENVATTTDINATPIPLSKPTNTISPLGKQLRGKLLYNHVSTATRSTAMERFKALKEGQNFHDLDSALKTTYSNAERTQNTIYLRLAYDEPSGTVVNVRKSMWVHPTLDRAISIREAARLQTFPDSFVFEGTKDSQYQQVGNAVPPFLAKAIANSLLNILDE